MTSDANTSETGNGQVLPRTSSGEPGSVHVLLGGSRTRVILTGEIDAELGPELLEAAAEAEDARQPVEVDSHHVSFMDSTGVAFLARLASRSQERLLLIRPPEVVRFLMNVTSIGELVTILDDDPGFDSSLPEISHGGPDLIA